MSFIMGSSCFLHSPISTSPSSPHTVYCYSSFRRNAQPNKTRNRGSSIVCLNNNEGDRNGGVGKRREILFLGVSILPFLGLNARAFEDLVTAPAIVKSYYDKIIVGCPGGEGEDEHDVVWFWLEKGKPHECPVCSQYFMLEVVGPGGPPDGHGDEDDHH